MPDAIITSTASTFGTISGTFAADQSTITGTVSGVITGTLSGSVGVPGPQGEQGIPGPIGPEGPPGEGGTWGSIVGTLSNQTDLQTALNGKYSTSNPAGYITSSALSPYLSKADNLASVASVSTARDNLGLGSLSNPTFAGVTVQGSGANVANLTPTSLSLTHATSGSFTIQPSVGITFPDATVQTTAYTGGGAAYISSVSSPLSVTSGNLTIDLSPYAPLASPVFTGNPTAPTAALGDNDTSIATTAFVQQELLSGTANARNLEVYVRNQTGSTIPAGSIVYINGATGNRPTITLAQANNDANSAQTFGFTKAAIANNGFGYVIVRGELENIDTSALTEGVQLYLSPTTAGTWTTTKPSAPQHLVYVGICVRAHPTQGVILVAVQNGYELDELHDVAIASKANNDLLAYESSTDLWKNKTYSALGLLTSATAASTYAPLASPSFTGLATFDNSTNYAITVPSGTAGYYSSISSGVYSIFFASTEVLRLSSSGIKYPDGVTQTVAFPGFAGYAPTASPALTGNVTITTNSASPALVITQDGTGDIVQFKDVTSDTTYSFIDASGKVGTIASTTANAGFNIAHGAAPTTPVNGDIWTTTSGVFARINGATRQYVDFDGTQTINGAKTFSNANLTLGNSTAAGTISIGTGATISGSTKAILIGPNGVAGSTTSITVGSSTGTSTTTLQGTTNGVTAAADTNSVALATTAFVVGQAGSATPLVNGTAAVGTSLRYARQDHVHGTDTTRAALAGATFTGLVSTPASATGSSGFRIVPGVAPTTPTNGDLWATTTDLQVRLNGVTETLAEQSWVTAQGYITSSALTPYLTTATAASTYQTLSGMSSYLTTASAASTYAPLASPTFTGTVIIPAGASISGYATTASLASYAPLASPALTGTPTSTTAAVDTNTTQIATTAYVVGQGYLKSATASTTYAPLASPALTGTPTAPTATAGTSTTQLATTAFVTTADNLKANLASPALTGTPTAPTATAGTNTTQIATTAFVRTDNNVKAWVNFNGTGTVAIRASFNVSSITDNGVGDYTVNFTTAMVDTNYSVFATAVPGSTNEWRIPIVHAKGVSNYSESPTTSAFRLVWSQSTTVVPSTDIPICQVCVIR